MKINRFEITLPADTQPRLSSKLDNIAGNLARFAAEFGITVNDRFSARLAAIGFGNGVQLGLHEPAEAAKFEELLAADLVPLEDELPGLAEVYGEFALTEADWTSVTCRFLEARWILSADNVPNLEPRLEARLRVLHGVRAGLVVARENTDRARQVSELIKTLWAENRYLAGCLWRWSGNDWEPLATPFVEFMSCYYPSGTVECRVLCQSAAEVYPIAKALTHPWQLGFWAETGWTGGRNLARDRRADAEAMLKEAKPETLKLCHRLYERFVLNTLSPDGTVQILSATLAYFGECQDQTLARGYCAGHEPRRLARIAYDFGFWMGVLSSYPVPSTSN